MTVRGLLLINHRGEAYFIEGGIKADKLSNDLRIDAANAVEADIPLEGHMISLADLKAKAEAWRAEWNAALPDPFPTLPANVGPIVFQAFNVEADSAPSGDAIITGSASGIDLT
jgi:hypothetical protein